MDDIAIGIDLGTTNSCASYYADGRLRVLINREGGRITPSVVFYTEKQPENSIVGEYAKKMATLKPEYAVFEIKRLVGRKTDDTYVQNNLKYFPFKLDPSCNEPVILIEHPNDTLKKNPVDICAAILKKIKRDSEDIIGHSVEKAVITVPAYFNINQREVTLAAANKAGFKVLKLLNEPTAAALSYYLENNFEGENHSLVYDLGGGTFDVAVLKKSKNNIEIIGVDGHSHLGGQDFDNLIKDYVCDELKKRFDFNVRTDRRAMRRLHNYCEEAKRSLSVTEEATLVLDGFVKGHDTVEVVLTREKFETICGSLFRKTIRIVENCLKSCDLPKSAIKEVIMSGGSSRILKIQQLLSEFFDGKALNKFVNPDECVAEGAALQAAMLNDNPKQQVDHFQISDVTPLSLGLASFVHMMSFLIRKNTRIPFSASETRVNVYNEQKSIAFQIYEGERLDSRKNQCLGKLTINNITPSPPAQCSVIVTFSIDNNGILTASAKEKYKDNYKDLKVTYTKGRISDKEVKNALKDADDHKEEDEKFRIFAIYKYYLLEYCINIIYHLEKDNLTETYKDKYDLCKKIQKEGDNLEMDKEVRLKELIKTVEEAFGEIVQKHNFQPRYAFAGVKIQN